MKIDFECIGTAEQVTNGLDEAQKAASLAATTPNEVAGVEGAFDALGAILTSVDGDRQATVSMHGEVRGDELTHVYLEVTVVPSGAVQEAKADAERARASNEPADKAE